MKNMEPGLYNEENELIYTWNELIDKEIIKINRIADEKYLTTFNLEAENEILILSDDINGIEYDAIWNSIGTLYIPKNIWTIDMVSRGLGQVKEFIVDPENEKYSSEKGVLFNKSKSRLIRYPCLKEDTKYTIPDSVEIIEFNSFLGCNELEEIKFSKNIKIIEAYAFYECNNIKNIQLNEGLEYIGPGAFEETFALQNIYIPSTLTNIESNAIDTNYRLTNITVSDKNPVYDSRNNCNAIIETKNNKLIFGSLNTTIPNDVEIIGKDSLNLVIGSLTIPKSVKKIEGSPVINPGIENIKYCGLKKDLEKIDGYEYLKKDIERLGIKLTFNKTLDELLNDGYTFRDANKILKEQIER